MPLNFPSNPVLNQIYVYNGIRWRWSGYAWDSAGICGALNVGGGICGDYVAALTGGSGITLTGPSGVVEISLKLDEPNIGPINTPVQHTSPNTFSGDTGVARKVAFLEADGSVSFDFIKNYDVFRQAEFNFDIVSFSIPGLSPQLAGVAGSLLQLNGYVASMVYLQSAIVGKIFITNATPTQQFGFPADILSLDLTSFNFTTQALQYKQLTSGNDITLNNDGYVFRLGVTGENSDGTAVYKTKDLTLNIFNHIIFGTSQISNASSIDLTDQSFSRLLNGTRNYTININIPQDIQNPYYLYYAHPSRLGQARFRDNATGLEGGFEQPVQVNYSNPRGYIEAYNVYRSENPNLGQVSITVL